MPRDDLRRLREAAEHACADAETMTGALTDPAQAVVATKLTDRLRRLNTVEPTAPRGIAPDNVVPLRPSLLRRITNGW